VTEFIIADKIADNKIIKIVNNNVFLGGAVAGKK
jgi:hypothetical protein